MGTLASKLFTECEPDTATMLENCANGFPSQVQSHFSTRDNNNGEHIRLVKTALERIGKADTKLVLPAFSIDNSYDSAFAAAIKVYKKERDLRNFADQIDDVIGIKTIRQLDDDVTEETPKPKPAAKPAVDLFLYMSGFVVPGGQDITGVTATGPGFRAMEPIRNAPSRSIFKKTFKAWQGSLSVDFGIKSAADFIQTHYDFSNVGRVVAYGYSAGGSNMLDLGRELEARNASRDGVTKKFLIIDLLITVDAAERDDLPRKVRREVAGSIRRNINYFQTTPSFAGAHGGLNISVASAKTGIKPDVSAQTNMDSLVGVLRKFGHGRIEEISLINVTTDIGIISFTP